MTAVSLSSYRALVQAFDEGRVDETRVRIERFIKRHGLDTLTEHADRYHLFSFYPLAPDPLLYATAAHHTLEKRRVYSSFADKNPTLYILWQRMLEQIASPEERMETLKASGHLPTLLDELFLDSTSINAVCSTPSLRQLAYKQGISCTRLERALLAKTPLSVWLEFSPEKRRELAPKLLPPYYCGLVISQTPPPQEIEELSDENSEEIDRKSVV